VSIALLTCLATTLSFEHWLRFVVASSAGAFAGICVGFLIWWPSDPIAAPYLSLVVPVATLMAALVSLVAGLIVRQILESKQISISNEKPRRAIWLLFVCCVALGPVALALTPPLVAHRIKRNDRLAAERFESLKTAVERTMAESRDPKRICDGSSLKQNYSGPPFSENDWRYIAGNAVKQDGYLFYVSIYCPQPGKFAIQAFPERQKGDGTRRFRAEESGRVGRE
jgi:hypothetical protein